MKGLGMGAINSTCPVLMAEVSPKASRGRYVCAQLSTLNLGIFLACECSCVKVLATVRLSTSNAIADWVGYGFSSISGSKAWRIPVALQAVFIIPIIILTFLVPESPRWDVAHDNPDRALNTIARLNARPATDPVVVAQFEEITHAVQLERSVGSGSWRQLFAWRDDEIKSRRRLLIACFIQAAQQLGGINGIVSGPFRLPRSRANALTMLCQIYYAGNLLSAAGLDAHGSSLVSGFLFTVSPRSDCIGTFPLAHLRPRHLT
jgi:MFS family permease